MQPVYQLDNLLGDSEQLHSNRRTARSAVKQGSGKI